MPQNVKFKPKKASWNRGSEFYAGRFNSSTTLLVSGTTYNEGAYVDDAGEYFSHMARQQPEVSGGTMSTSALAYFRALGARCQRVFE